MSNSQKRPSVFTLVFCFVWTQSVGYLYNVVVTKKVVKEHFHLFEEVPLATSNLPEYSSPLGPKSEDSRLVLENMYLFAR